jgi:hypothetical protein
MRYLMTVIVAMASSALLGQTSEIITVKAGQNISEVYKEIFRYPQFIAGRVYFVNGDVSAAKLNYNLITETMLFVNQKGDTLMIADATAVKFITIEKDSFYYDNGYLELLDGNKSVRLAMKQRIKFSDKKKIGAFGMPTSTVRTESDDTFLGDRRFSFLVAEDLIFKKETEFYMSQGSNSFIILNKKNLLKTFPKNKENIEDFLKEKNINLQAVKDVEILIQYLSKLS